MAFDLTSLDGVTVAGTNVSSQPIVDNQDSAIADNFVTITGVRNNQSAQSISYTLQNVQLGAGENGTAGTVDIFRATASNSSILVGTFSIIGFSDSAVLVGKDYSDPDSGWGSYLLISDVSLVGQITFADSMTLRPDPDAAGFVLPACLMAGTRILTPLGEMAVEDLAKDDEVITVSGTVRKIVWVGHRTVDCRRHAQPEKVYPVRIAAGAFADGVPSRDLFLSPDHAVFIEGDAEDRSDDVLILVQDLVNGTTIVQVPAETVTYHHIELWRHDAVLAEGLAVETYLDTGNRAAFADGGIPMQLHVDFGAMMWEAAGCAPLVVTGEVRDAVWLRLQQRATSLHQAKAHAA